jgi:hypothetical protein
MNDQLNVRSGDEQVSAWLLTCSLTCSLRSCFGLFYMYRLNRLNRFLNIANENVYKKCYPGLCNVTPENLYNLFNLLISMKTRLFREVQVLGDEQVIRRLTCSEKLRARWSGKRPKVVLSGKTDA